MRSEHLTKMMALERISGIPDIDNPTEFPKYHWHTEYCTKLLIITNRRGRRLTLKNRTMRRNAERNSGLFRNPIEMIVWKMWDINRGNDASMTYVQLWPEPLLESPEAVTYNYQNRAGAEKCPDKRRAAKGSPDEHVVDAVPSSCQLILLTNFRSLGFPTFFSSPFFVHEISRS